LNVPFYDQINDFINNNLLDEYIGLLEIHIYGNASNLYYDADKEEDYNEQLSKQRIDNMSEYIKDIYDGDLEADFGEIIPHPLGSGLAEEPSDPDIIHTKSVKKERNVEIVIRKNDNINVIDNQLSAEKRREKQELIEERDKIESKISNIEQKVKMVNSNEFKRIDLNDNFYRGFEGVEKDRIQPCFFSQTPEDFHRRLTFLQQCMRQGKNIEDGENTNSVFGKQPVCVLRIGDFYHTKIIIENLAIDYSVDVPWDLNPEGMGVQPMIAEINLKVKVIGGQSLATPIAQLQNALSFNYYANSTFYDNGTYSTPKKIENQQINYNNERYNND
ncbi:MAG: hypothetical protein ACOC2W_03475, partial [bacterium]